MIATDKSFTSDEIRLLKRTRGSMLLSMDAVLVAPPDNSWNTVRLHFDGFSLDINNRLGEIRIDEFGTLEEFGLLSIAESDKRTLEIPEASVDATTIDIERHISGVNIVNDLVEVYGDGTLVAAIKYPQAIAFQTDGDVIVLDKEVWFSEMLTIKLGDDIEDLIYDESVNWEDDSEEDPGTRYVFKTEIASL